MKVSKLGPLATVLMMVSTVAACKPKPVVTEIEVVVPGMVATSSDASRPTTFVLEARLWTWLGTERVELPESDRVKPKWTLSASSGSGVGFVGSRKGYRVTLRVDPPAQPHDPCHRQGGGRGHGRRQQDRAIRDIRRRFARRRVRGQSDPGRGSRTRHTNSKYDNPCAVWLTPALVRIGMAGSVTAVCGGTGSAWSLALLDAAHGMEMYAASWTCRSRQGASSEPADHHSRHSRRGPGARRGAGNLVSRQKSAWKYLLY